MISKSQQETEVSLAGGHHLWRVYPALGNVGSEEMWVRPFSRFSEKGPGRPPTPNPVSGLPAGDVGTPPHCVVVVGIGSQNSRR
jgi:hypothetical protein